MKIGVLAVQGAFREHEQMLQNLGAQTVYVKKKEHLEGLDGIVIPGGESTAIGRLMREYDLIAPIREMAANGIPMMGTCAGMIVLAKRIANGDEPHLAVMDVEVDRNSFGRQRESFETDLDIPAIGEAPFPAVFIRAPHIRDVGPDVTVLAKYENRVVGVQQGHLLAFSFHPELTADDRIHRYFLQLVEARTKQPAG
ncbi:pyridoxal 5'-phosphate synthase glutaminase subunit PdxT [Alicyclobacillus cycloheptanicus]|uniref:Pyridoxal 5'-phosphate synthase subunit PdxT n=1 Tax=Alicyclobacillus cycloheptanicus TaxID=1457 RepID=A0ABT9XLV0_9BACL|nr:pyridoxal 5'-phosphate synthase glutaminase subunit PdxT [Alicyclobacillus cycloheptanicus]MDQ0191290.1 5'-phosphate synthase pdxT subunit [Alicyclobacillus cycloheptanicus]WDM02410.1 pyridoxal 5'-phosphate synthase glutaminase subunit PdxT [Alicyclobacillus cycloheptanicus]